MNHEMRSEKTVTANWASGIGHAQAELKWGMLMLFVIGYAVTASRFNGFATDYLLYSLVALCSCALLLALLEFDKRHAPAWLGLIVLVTVYFVRFYWVAIDSSPLLGMLPWAPYRDMKGDMTSLMGAFKLSVIAFTSFSLSVTTMLVAARGNESESNPLQKEAGGVDILLHRLAPKFILPILLSLMFALAYLALRFHIGQMGMAPGEPLPFRLKGVIAYARIVLLPLLILQVICSAERSGQSVFARIGILLLLVHGVSDMLIRGSRSSLLLSVLLLAFAVMAGGLKLRWKGIAIASVFGVLAIAVTPALTVYRGLRARQDDLPMTDALVDAFSSLSDAWWSGLVKGIEFVFFRIPGVELLWAILNRGVEPLGMRSLDVFSSLNGMAGYLTYHVYQANPAELTLFAPGFAGWLYLVGGMPAIAVGSALIAILGVLGWKYLSRDRWLCGPLARTFLLWMIFMALAEGTLDGMGFTLLVGVLTISALEIGLRIARKYLESRAEPANGR